MIPPLLAALATAACASAPVALDPAAADERTLAAVRLEEGCHDCLQDARRLLARQLSGRDSVAIAQQIFEIDLLLVLRAKELGIDHASALEQARISAERAGGGAAHNRLLRIVTDVAPDIFSVPVARFDTLRARQRGLLGRASGELEWVMEQPLTPLVRDYLAITLSCGSSTGLDERLIQHISGGAPVLQPILEYRRAVCTPDNARMMRQLRAVVPRFTETSFFLAIFASRIADQVGEGSEGELLDEMLSHFPGSLSAHYLRGTIHSATGGCETGLTNFDAVLAVQPGHDDAILGRAVCMTRLKRHDEAITIATSLIVAKSARAADAFYWRAQNHRFRGELPRAREDADSAVALKPAMEVLTLAGMIRYELEELEIAQGLFNRARALPKGSENCVAIWYIGRIELDRKSWPAAVAAFESSMSCFDSSVQKAETEIAKVRGNPDLNAAFKEFRIAALQQYAADGRSQYYASAFNAAGGEAQQGNFPRARELADIAARDQELTSAVAQLRAAIGGRLRLR
jgi:tetratricopeptide (TPR) repeat protein